MSCKSATSLMIACDGIRQSINQLVALQSKPDAPQLLEKLGMTIVDVNRTINLLGEYDRILEHVLRKTNVEWPPNLDDFLWSE